MLNELSDNPKNLTALAYELDKCADLIYRWIRN